MHTRRTCFALAFVAAWSLSAAAGSAQTTLRYKFKEGDKLRYVLDTKMKMSMNILGKVIDMTMVQDSELTWNVQSVDDNGNAKILVKFGRSKLSMDGPTGKTEVDSQGGQEPEDAVGQVLYKVIKGLAGMELTGAISPTGEFTDIKIPESSLKGLQNIPGGDAFGELFSPDGLKRMLGQSGLAMPKDAVSKGATWKNKSEMKLPIGKMIAEIDYTYGGPIEKDGRTLEKITLKPKATIEPDPNAPIAMKLKSQDGTGTALFDNKAGRLLEVVQNQTMEMEAEVMGMTFSQRMVQTVTMRLADKN